MNAAGAVAVAALAALAIAAPANAVTLVNPAGRTAQPFQRWADAARVPVVAGTVTLVASTCPGEIETSCTRQTIPTVWLFTAGSSRLDRRGDLLHELGHRFDYGRLTDAERNRFRALIHDRRPWRSTPDSPHEQFAEAYALCGLGGRMSDRYRDDGIGYGYDPNRRDERAICRLIRGAASPASAPR